MSVNHNKWMNFAILQGLRSKGSTKKNPPVGCVIVKNNILLSYGRTGLSGRPHAEEEAINKFISIFFFLVRSSDFNFLLYHSSILSYFDAIFLFFLIK